MWHPMVSAQMQTTSCTAGWGPISCMETSPAMPWPMKKVLRPRWYAQYARPCVVLSTPPLRRASAASLKASRSLQQRCCLEGLAGARLYMGLGQAVPQRRGMVMLQRRCSMCRLPGQMSPCNRQQCSRVMWTTGCRPTSNVSLFCLVVVL